MLKEINDKKFSESSINTFLPHKKPLISCISMLD